ncbi:hypothetical protein [Aestuariispira ectoiniformans]|uniref:hypothetical protein n=1 Tax=Aestuariispira ectoiniformans TaxID=2775080 RepID=UPI00223B3A9E|nr:hypothetical protein [Aestuariispira ectoiniformans]
MQTQFSNTEAFHAFLIANGVANDQERERSDRWDQLVKQANDLTDDLSLDEDLEGISLEDWERWYDH